MKLWVDGKPGSPGSAVRATVKEQVANVNWQVKSRGTRVVNVLRTAEFEVLEGQRSGRKYHKPYTGKLTTKERKKRHYETPVYTASAPGEPPARRTGNLRMHWNGQVKDMGASGGGIQVVAELESQERYAGYLESGTSRMAPRPFVDRIIKKAAPEIEKIYQEPYT